MAGSHVLVHLRHCPVDRNVAVLTVHVVVAGTRVIAHPDAVGLHRVRLLLAHLLSADTPAALGSVEHMAPGPRPVPARPRGIATPDTTVSHCKVSPLLPGRNWERGKVPARAHTSENCPPPPSLLCIRRGTVHRPVHQKKMATGQHRRLGRISPRTQRPSRVAESEATFHSFSAACHWHPRREQVPLCPAPRLVPGEPHMSARSPDCECFSAPAPHLAPALSLI